MMKVADFKGKQGPRDKVVTKLSSLAAIAVDFAKHGLCVPQEEINTLQEKVLETRNYTPDFLNDNNTNKKKSKSATILGELFRAVDTHSMIQECFDQEHKRGVLVDGASSYRLNLKIICYLLGMESFDPNHESWDKFFRVLKKVYRIVVRPFELEFKQLMEHL